MALSPRLQMTLKTLSTLPTLAKSLVTSGIVDPKGPVKATAGLIPGLARYWFSFAREVEAAYEGAPDRVALIDDDGTLTYREMRNQSRTIARYLLSLQLDTIRLGIMARNGRGILLPMAAKGYAGAEMYLLNVGSSPEQVLGCLQENNINVLFVDDEFADRLPENYPGLTVVIAHADNPIPADTESMDQIVRHPERYADISLPLMPRHGKIVLMSSGTSGVPKGVVRPEPRLPVVLSGYLTTLPMRAGDTIQMTASMFHTWGWGATNVAVGARCTIVTQRVFNAENCWRQIEKYRADALVSSPIFIKQMLQLEGQEKFDTSSLRYLASSGNALTPALVQETIERFGPILANIYGSTELTLAATATAEAIAADPTVAGRVSPGTILKVLDAEGNELPQGEVGRIHLRNSTSLTGYTNPAIEIVQRQGLIEIGDLGYIDDDGYLHVLGRIDDMIIVGGENVYPRSVEEILEPMPGVADLTAKGVDDAVTFKRIAVWIVREDSPEGNALTEDAVRQWVSDKLADHSIPRDVHFVEELPRNATGKVMPRMLVDEA
ncbi:AMP-binding protein [Corynebacterium uterequi]|uniref:Acyl-CoA synthetase (AMP-forming)/AMP-acid ligase II n=1 Tax=Corynebacterium uterequi TaxID=1072256 RepID=A0A0G3HA81_9CORY|nr:AMP-binding protein [Corynebacterium uterequi]AKK10224.1 acyl-CoA synthetase (AMP-forming)/AMP-acid ligase II [Corynebacterium uterequi]